MECHDADAALQAFAFQAFAFQAFATSSGVRYVISHLGAIPFHN